VHLLVVLAPLLLPCTFTLAHTQSAGSFEEPLFPASEMGSIIPADTKKPFDIRKVNLVNKLTVRCCVPVSCGACVIF
jgi:hypothetical protein